MEFTIGLGSSAISVDVERERLGYPNGVGDLEGGREGGREGGEGRERGREGEREGERKRVGEREGKREGKHDQQLTTYPQPCGNNSPPTHHTCISTVYLNEDPFGQTSCYEGLGYPASSVHCRTIHFRTVLTREGSTPMGPPATVRVYNDLTSSQSSVTLGNRLLNSTGQF